MPFIPLGSTDIDRIVADIGGYIHAITVTARVGLPEPAQLGIVEARLVFIEAQFGYPCLSRILEPPDIGRTRHAIFVVAVGADYTARAVGDCNDAAAFVGVEQTAVGKARAFVPDDRGVGAGAVDIAAGEGVAAIIAEPGDIAALHNRLQAAQRVIGQARASGTDLQHIVAAIAIGRRPNTGDVAARIMGEAQCPCAGNSPANGGSGPLLDAALDLELGVA